MDLIDDHQLADLLAQEGVGVGQAAAIGLALQVEVDGAGTPSADQSAGQRGLSHLSWSEQHNSGEVPEAILDRGGHPPSEGSHPRNSNINRLISGDGFKYPISARDGVEVDVVIERGGQSVAGVEVEAAATVSAADFRGAVPIRALWEAP